VAALQEADATARRRYKKHSDADLYSVLTVSMRIFHVLPSRT
jgi:hypothetical protein